MDEKQQLSDKWEDIKYTVKNDNDIMDVAYDIWIVPMKIYSVENDLVKILIPSEQASGVSYISKKYLLPFKVAISEIMNHPYEIEFVSENDIKSPVSKRDISAYPQDQITRIQKANLNPKYTFSTFVVGPNNKLAHSAAMAVSADPGNVYNPLFLYGGPGLGKTHLMHSIGHQIINSNPNMNVRYATSETFTNEVIESIQTGGQSKLREKYRTVDVLLLDDVQFIIGKDQTQIEFFNTFNALHEQNKAIILSSDKPPRDMKTLDDRLKSRFEWGMTVDINPPDYETRMAILRKYSEMQDIEVNDEIIQYIASNIHTNIRELEGALNKVAALANLQGKTVTLDDAANAIKDMLKDDNPRILTTDMIISGVSKYFSITPEEIKSQKRSKDIVFPRHIAMYLCRKKLNIPLADIGKSIGNRDHTTVLHGYEKIDEEISTNENTRNIVNEIEQLLINSN